LTEELSLLGEVVDVTLGSNDDAVAPGDTALQVERSGDRLTASPLDAEQPAAARPPSATLNAAPGGVEIAADVAATVEPALPPALHENAARGLQPDVANNSSQAAVPITNDASASTAPADGARDETASKRQHPAVSKDFGSLNHATPLAGSGPSKTEKTAVGNRWGSDKSNGVEDVRRRANDGTDRHSTQRTDSASNGPATTAAIVTTAVRDVVSPAASRSGDDTAAAGTRNASTKIDSVPHALGRSDRAHAAARRGATADRATNLPRVDAARFVGRVAKAIQTAAQRGGSLQLRLSPPELGSLRLELSVQNGVMSASLEAESPVARQMLLDHLPALRDRLAEQNIRIDRFDVDVRQDGSGGQADSRASQHEQRGQQSQHPTPRREAIGGVSGDDALRDSIITPTQTANGGINVLA
jgi:flagellar hook-length control protein FliK